MPGLTEKYKASTLIEVLVAMVIILICAGMGMTIYSNMGRDVNGNMEIQADIYMNKVVIDTKIERDYTDNTFEFTGIRIERVILPFKDEKRLRILHVEAYNTTSRKVGEVKELISVTP